MNDTQYPEPVRATTTPTKPPRKPRKPMKTGGVVALSAIVALLVGAGSGYAAGINNVPDPVQVEVEKEVIKNVDVPYTPQSCIDALDSAEQLRLKAVEALEISSGYVDIIPDAFEAGAFSSLPGGDAKQDKVLSDMKMQNDSIGTIGEELEPIIEDYNSSFASCRSEG